MEQNWAGAYCSLNSVWHWPSRFLLLASCLGRAMHRPSTGSLCKARDAFCLHSNRGLSAYCTNSCQRDCQQNSAKENAEHVCCFYWNVCKCCKYCSALVPAVFAKSVSIDQPVWASKEFSRFGQWWQRGRGFLFQLCRAWPLVRALVQPVGVSGVAWVVFPVPAK